MGDVEKPEGSQPIDEGIQSAEETMTPEERLSSEQREKWYELSEKYCERLLGAQTVIDSMMDSIKRGELKVSYTGFEREAVQNKLDSSESRAGICTNCGGVRAPWEASAVGCCVDGTMFNVPFDFKGSVKNLAAELRAEDESHYQQEHH